MNKSNKVFLQSYIYLVLVTGILLFYYIVSTYQDISILGILLFGILILISDNLSAPLPKAGSVSVNFGLSFASLIIFGPATALIVTLISVINIREIIKRVPYYKHLFNAGQYIISMAIASVVFEALYVKDVENFFYAQNIGVIFLSAFVFFFLNTFLTAGVISINNRISIFNVWVFNFAWLIPFQVFLSAMAIAIAFLYSLYGPFTLIFTCIPLIIAQYTYLLRIKERRTILKSILQIVKIVEAKDHYTAGHSIRVAQYCEMIARELKFNEYDIEIMDNLARLHDIGKIQVELATLNKAKKLNKKEWEEMKRHPVTGYDIVKQMDFLKTKADAILYHHEREDGKGYPYGKNGSDIPLFAKILAVADAYDAMTTDRPYRKALTEGESLRELIKNRGTQFDEKICDIMIDLVKRGIKQKAFQKQAEKDDLLNTVRN